MDKQVETASKQVSVDLDAIRSNCNTETGVNALVDSAIGASKAAHREVARALVAVVYHAHTTDDVRPMRRLVTDIANYGQRRNAAIAVCEKCGPVAWDSKSKKFRFRKARKIEDYSNSKQLLELLEMAAKWQTQAPEPPYRGFALADRLTPVINKALERSTSKKKADNVPSDLLNDLVQLAVKHGLTIDGIEEASIKSDLFDDMEIATKQAEANAEAAEQVILRSTARKQAAEQKAANG